jgi:hypothetical protein
VSEERGIFVFTSALIPAFSPKEKENRAPSLWKYQRRDWPDSQPKNQNRTSAVPSPGGEGQDEGGRDTIIATKPKSALDGKGTAKYSRGRKTKMVSEPNNFSHSF